ncbi:MAG: cysteine hydrolase [Firmicutes bacterium]|nr:cysteine hydrolase [Bacillota bacterium]
MKKLLIVVDYQNDFVNGSLGFPEAVQLEKPICEKIEKYRAMGDEGQIIFTMDTHDRHYLDTIEGKNLPVPHCIDGEDGWQLYGAVADLKAPEDLVFSKPTFGSLELADYLRNRGAEYESVEFVGVVTNICVISNVALVKAAMPDVLQIVDTACIASNDPALQEAALKVMESVHVKLI